MRWVLIDGTETDENRTVFSSGTAAISDGNYRWMHMTASDIKRLWNFRVSLCEIDEDGEPGDEEYVTLKDWLSDAAPVNRVERIIKASGMTRKDLAEKYGIPYRSLSKWHTGERECPDYVLDMLERLVWEDKEFAER